MKVIVRVGEQPNQEEFIIEEHLLQRSRFFENVIKWKEKERAASKLTTQEPRELQPTQTIITLVKDDPTVFKLYTKWLQLDFLSMPVLHKGMTHRELFQEQHLLCSAYMFGEAYQETAFQDTVIDALQHRSHHVEGYFLADTELLWKVFNNTSKNSALRQLIADHYVWNYGDQSWQSDKMYREAHSDFYYHTSLSLRKKVNAPLMKPPTERLGECWYHAHKMVEGSHEDDTCYKQKMHFG